MKECQKLFPPETCLPPGYFYGHSSRPTRRVKRVTCGEKLRATAYCDGELRPTTRWDPREHVEKCRRAGAAAAAAAAAAAIVVENEETDDEEVTS